ncbi:Four and a half LIM domains protein 5, partial [Ophiophagus hannah]
MTAFLLTFVKNVIKPLNVTPRILLIKAAIGMKRASSVPNAITPWLRSPLQLKTSSCCVQLVILMNIHLSAFTARGLLCLVVTNGGVTYHDQPWHKECFLCTGCKKQLAEHRFMSKDEHPFCLECFSGHFAKKCVACTEPIT